MCLSMMQKQCVGSVMEGTLTNQVLLRINSEHLKQLDSYVHYNGVKSRNWLLNKIIVEWLSRQGNNVMEGQNNGQSNQRS